MLPVTRPARQAAAAWIADERGDRLVKSGECPEVFSAEIAGRAGDEDRDAALRVLTSVAPSSASSPPPLGSSTTACR